MKDESPNGLVMSPEPVVARMGRWPLYALLIVLILLENVRHTPCYTSFFQRIQAKAR